MIADERMPLSPERAGPFDQKLVVIAGPTAVGKTRAAVLVAEALGGEIVCADSRLVYRGMDIGTAKPEPELRSRVRHHLIDLVEPAQVFSAGQYRQRALLAIAETRARGRLPVVVGGTGLYIRALLRGLWPGPAGDWCLRAQLIRTEALRGRGYLHRWLHRLDPSAAERIHVADLSKTVRALEVALLTGRPITAHHEAHPLPQAAGRAIVIGLRRQRQDLYRRINERVDQMLTRGLVEEVRRLLAAGHGPDIPAMRGLGYRQIVSYLQGEYPLEMAIRTTKRDTRRYAKRQMTWFRREPEIEWIDLEPTDDASETARKILDRLRSRTGSGSDQPPAGRTPVCGVGTVVL